jgi:hypothetical protein
MIPPIYHPFNWKKYDDIWQYVDPQFSTTTDLIMGIASFEGSIKQDKYLVLARNPKSTSIGFRHMGSPIGDDEPNWLTDQPIEQELMVMDKSDSFFDIPETLNLRKPMRGEVKCYIELPEGLDVQNIDVNTVKIRSLKIMGAEPVEFELPVESQPTELGDYDNDGLPDLMVKFSRADLRQAIGGPAEVQITAEGVHADTPFCGTETVAAIQFLPFKTQGGVSTRFSAGEKGYLKFRFGVANRCYVIARCGLVDTSTGTLLSSFKKKGVVNSGVYTGSWLFELPQGLAPGTRVKALLKIDKINERGASPISLAKDQIPLVIQ